ncbi:MAG: 50S ribosomal protein L4 [Patescibacteria group bacterium]|nr:MAG: 50S ribosomal protein L4 [Patescibacteria group bacterium]
MKVTSITASNKFSTVTVSDEVFGAAINKELLSQAIRVYLSNLRQGTSRVKTRSEVTGSRRKIWKQKGTGNARHGAKSAPIFVGGGVAHGPKGIENWDLSLSKVMKRKALISALSAQAENIVVTDNLSEIEGKTKNAAKLLNTINVTGKKVLLVLDEGSKDILRAFNNIPEVIVMQDSLVNALDVASVESIIMTKAALKNIEARLAVKNQKDVVAKAEVAKEAE